MLLWEQAHSNNVMAPSDNQAGDVQAASSSQTPSRIQLACPKCGQTKVLDFASTAFPQNLLCEHCRHPTRNAFALPPASPTQQETDLAAAFARTLSLEHRPSLWSPPPRPALTDRGDGSQVHYLARAPSAWPPAKPTAPVYASVHYTHSAHLQPAAAEPYMREGYGRGGGDGDVEMGG